MSEASQEARELKSFLERTFGSTLKAWISALDVDNVQRIHKIKFNEILRKFKYPGNIAHLFNALDDDGSGELTMSEIDPVQAELWNRFREWCVANFRSVDELLTRFGNSNEERLRQRQTIKARLSALTEAQFRKRMRDIGWLFEEEELLFFALDSQGEGVLRREDFRWLDAEFWRIRRKMEAKSRSIHSLQKMQARDAQQAGLESFKQFLIKKHGNIVRAWRLGLGHDQMVLPKVHFLKAMASLGFSHEARDLYRLLDKDQSGFASLEELDPLSAELLARFKQFLEKKLGSVGKAFEQMDLDHSRKVSFQQFERALHTWGWQGNIKQLFQYLDTQKRKVLEESDLQFLEKWSPLPYFLAEPNYKARDEIRDRLSAKYGGHFMKAWRHLLDKDGSNRCNYAEFQAACQKLRYHGDIPGAWRAFDDDLSGYITLNEIDTEANSTLCEFKSWAWQEFGTVRGAFGAFDHDNSNSLSFQEFRGNCRIYGYRGNIRKLFQALDVNQEGTLSLSEVTFLDDWDMDKTEASSTKTDKRESHLRQMNEHVRRHEKKHTRVKRLTELPVRFSKEGSAILTAKAEADRLFEEESERCQKVAQVKQSLQLRADLPLIPLYHWPERRLPGDEEERHLPHHCELRKDRERKHWVQEVDAGFVPESFGTFAQDAWFGAQSEAVKDVPTPMELPPARPRCGAPLKPTLDELLAHSLPSKGARLPLGGLMSARLPRLPGLEPKMPNTAR